MAKPILKYIILSLSVLSCIPIWAQGAVLDYSTFIERVARQHPLTRQANLRNDQAQARMQAARGMTDPQINLGFDQKHFDKKSYYRYYDVQVKVPTLSGLDVTAGYENSGGLYLNPESKTDRFGLWSVGLEMNVWQGVLLNERKTALRQARVYFDWAESERQIILNELFYEAAAAYLEWQRNYWIREVILESITLAEAYFENTRTSFLAGEKTAVDTLEAHIILQDRRLALQSQEALLAKARLNMEAYHWRDDSPISLPPDASPEPIERTILSRTANTSVEDYPMRHPEIQAKMNKREYLEIERRWKQEKLRPKLKLKYAPLFGTRDGLPLPSTFRWSNHKFGVDFSMPLFFRKERAGVEMSRIKIKELDLDIANKRNQIKIKIDNSLEQQGIIAGQIRTQASNLDGYRLLLEAENEKFRYGESSVFLVNKRQEKYLNGRIKAINLNAKLLFERLSLLYYTYGW